jgi:hypothetical protein
MTVDPGTVLSAMLGAFILGMIAGHRFLPPRRPSP